MERESLALKYSYVMKFKIFDRVCCLRALILSHIALAHSVFAQPEMPSELPHPYPTALTVEVVGEGGDPIAGAKLQVGFYNPRHPSISRRGQTEWFKDYAVPDDGKIRVEESTFGSIRVVALKEGYYNSTKEYRWDVYATWKQVSVEQRLIPWNPTMKIMLKKIGDTVTMLFTQDFSKKLPGLAEEYPMDLQLGDWLPPHGKGKTVDAYFSVVGNLASSKLIIRFPNIGDGMIRVEGLPGSESKLKFPRVAPADGYSREVEISKVYDSYEGPPPYEMALASGYIFRIRTPKGEVDSDPKALYGKMVNFSSFTGIRETKGAAFGPMWLYINPNPGDRRIEADLTRNLRKGEDSPKYP